MAAAGIRRATLGVAMAAALVLAPTASASVKTAGGFKYVTKTVTAKPGKRVSASAPCPSGTRVIGGGEKNGAGYGSFVLGQTFPYDDGDTRSTPDDGWRIRGKNLDTARYGIKVTAICGDTHLRYTHHNFKADAGTQTGDETVTCPGGTFVYSGGIEARARSKIALNSTFPESNTNHEWGAYVDNPGAETKATIHAICGGSKPSEDVGSLPETPPGPAQGTADAVCPNGRFAVGGGVSNNGGYQSLAINSLAPRGTDLWRGRLEEAITGSYNMNVTVICHKPLR